jgi:hypothetical protein
MANNILAVGSTVFEHSGKFWLFTNIAVPDGSTFNELHLFYSDSLEGEWTPHPNPIVSDVRRARPAGALFFEGGKLIRPGQDRRLRYGYALTLTNEVEVLSESDYKENPIGVPEAFARTPTINIAQNCE